MEIRGAAWSQPAFPEQDARNADSAATRHVTTCCSCCGECWRRFKTSVGCLYSPIDDKIVSKIVPRKEDARDEWLRKAIRLRRGCRVMTTIVLQSLVVIWAIWFISTYRRSQALMLPASTPLYVQLDKCQLRLVIIDKTTSPDNADPVEFQLERLPDVNEIALIGEAYIPAKYLPWHTSPVRFVSHPPRDSTATNQEDSFHHFVTEKDSYEDRMEDCKVSLVMRRGTHIPGLWVKCEEACVVSTDLYFVDRSRVHIGTLNMGKDWSVNQLIVDASEVTKPTTIVLGKLQTTYIWVHNANGDIFLEDVDVVGSSRTALGQSLIQVDHGDLHWQTNNDMRMSWNRSTSLYCLASPSTPDARFFSDCNSTNTSGNFTGYPATCAGSVNLCLSSTCTDEDLSALSSIAYETRVEEAKDNLPHISIQVPQGSFYTSRSYSPDDNTELSTLQGASFTELGDIAVDSDTAAALEQKIKAKLAVPATSNTAFVMIGPSNARTARPGQGFLFVMVPSLAYAHLRPWWLSFLSWNLLMNRFRVETVEVRLTRGPCPYHPTPDESSLSRIAKELSSHARAISENKMMYPLDNGLLPGEDKTFRFNDNYKLRWPIVAFSEVWWNLNETQHESTHAVRFSSDTSLLICFILSLTICVLVATIWLYYFSLFVSASVLYFESSGRHTVRYNAFIQAGEPHDSAFPSASNLETRHPGYPYGLGRPDGNPLVPPSNIHKSTDIDDEDEQAAFFDPMNIILGRTARLAIWRLPPIFGIIDHVFFLIQKHFANSMAGFVTLPGVLEDDNDSSTAKSSELLSDFKREYSRFCFVTRLREQNVQSEKGKKLLKKFGLEIQPVPAKEQADVFTHVRLQTRRELERQKSGVPLQQLPGETSLDYFLRARCRLTRFDADTIPVDHFKSMYIAFCEERRLLDAVTVSKALLQHHKGIGTTKLQNFRVVPSRSGKNCKRINLARAEKEVQKILARRAHTKQEVLFCAWSLMDVLTVVGHMIYISFICSPYFFATFAFAELYYPFSTQDTQYVFGANDFFASPALLYDKCRDGFPLFFRVATYSSLVLNICSWCQLMLYYLGMSFPIDTQESFAKSAKTRAKIVKLGYGNPLIYIFRMSFKLFCCARTKHEEEEEALTPRSGQPVNAASLPRTLTASSPPLAQGIGHARKGKHCLLKCVGFQEIMIDAFTLSVHYCQWIGLYLTVWTLTLLVTSFLIWCMLSALINPEAFLAYAAMAATLVSGVLAKYQQLKNLWRKNLDEIINIFMAVVQEKINFVIKTMVDGLNPSGEGNAVANQIGHVVGAVAGEDAEQQFTQHAMMLGGTSLGKNIVSAGFDVGLMLKLASGDHSAISEFAEQHGLPEEIGHLMTQIAYGNGDGVVRAISDLLEKNQQFSPIAPELAVALAELAFTPTRPKAEKFLRAVLHYGLPSMMKLWSSQVGLGSNAKLDNLNALIRDLASEDANLDVMGILRSVHTEKDHDKREANLKELLFKGPGVLDDIALKKREEALKKILDLASDASLREAGMATAAALTGNPAIAKLGMLVGSKSGVPQQSRKQAREMIDALLLDVLPTLLKGFVHLITLNDYQEFVTALRYVHSYLMDEKQLIIATFGKSFFENLEYARPIFHVLDLLLAKGQYQDAILEFIQDDSVLKLPKEVTLFVKIIVWLRVPVTKQDVLTVAKNPLQAKFLTSYTDRTQAVKVALNKLGIPQELHILAELLVAFALDDYRSMTHKNAGKKLAECIGLLVGESEIEDDFKKILADCFGYSLSFMVALNLGYNVDMFKTLQSRTGLDQEHMEQVVGLYLHSFIHPLEPPREMTEWHLFRATSSLVGLEIEEAVGLAHLCMGHTDSREATSFIRELLRRQHISAEGADRLVKNLLAISLASNDQCVMYALQELRVRSRFLSIMGLGYAPPRYFSEILLRSCGITNHEVLQKRLEVPFQYEDGSDKWDEWLQKAKSCIEGKPIGKWHHIADKGHDNERLASNYVMHGNSKRQKGRDAIEKSLMKRRKKKFDAQPRRPSTPFMAASQDDIPGRVYTDADLELGQGRRSPDVQAARSHEHTQIQARQLEWRSGALNTTDRDRVEFFVRHFNEQAETERSLWLSSQRASISSRGRIFTALPTAEDTHAYYMPKRNAQYEETLAQRLLLKEQDTSTGIIRPLHFSEEQYQILAKIMSFKTLVRPNEKDSKNRRNVIIQDFADMLGVGSRELNIFFDMVIPEQTKQARIAIEVLGRSHFPEGVCDALSQTVYNVKRAVTIFGEIRSKLWEISHRFSLPRFLGAATLLPHMSYPPQFREVGSIVHFFMAPVLSNPQFTASIQAVLYEVMGLTTGAPSNAKNLSRNFGLYVDGENSTAAIIVQTMVMSGISDKLESVEELLTRLLKGMSESNQQVLKELLPFVFFFAGFPYAELPQALRSLNDARADESSSRNVMQEISAKTNIHQSILSGIDLSIWSISPFSKSDLGSLNRESVLGLILPLFSDIRVRFPDLRLPNDGLVKAIVSLAYCAVDHLEFLAEAIGLDTFVTQLMVHLVHLSRNTSNSIHVNQIAQRIRVNAGIVQKLSVMGVPCEKFLSLLMLSFPHMDDVPAVPGLLERIGLQSLGVEVQWAEVFYALAVCSLNHLDRNCDPAKHLQLTKLLKTKLEPLLPILGFKHDLVATLGARLFLGDFYVIDEEKDNELMKLLLPFELERELAVSICGLLSHAPPAMQYKPAVVSGIVNLVAPEDGEVRIRAYHRDTLPSGEKSLFVFRLLLDGVEVDQDEFQVRAEDIHSRRYDDSARSEDTTASSRVDHHLCFTIVVRVPVPRGRKLRPEQLDIWWRSFPPVADLPKVRRLAATNGLRELEKLCWWERLHWGGVANSWWDGPLDLHPLIVLLAAGDVKAVQLASDLLGVPDIVLSYLFAHVISAPIEKLRPLLLSDLCSEPIVKNAVDQLGFPFETLKPPPIERDENVKPTDSKMPAKGFGRHLYLHHGSDEFRRVATLGSSEEQENEDQECEEDREEQTYDGDAEKWTSDNESDFDKEHGAEIVSRPVTSHALQRSSTDGQPDMEELLFSRPFRSLDVHHFPDELTELYSAESDHDDVDDEDQEDIEESDPLFSSLYDLVGDAPWSHWRQDSCLHNDVAESKFADLPEGYHHSLSEFCFNELKKCLGQQQHRHAHDPGLDGWLTHYEGMPYNVHLFLSLVLYKLFMLLDDDPEQSKDKVVDRMPTVSLVLTLAKIHQLRHEVCHRNKDKKPPKPAVVMFHMLPAMWGLEVHLRRAQKNVRKRLRREVEKHSKESKAHWDDKDAAWEHGGVAGFELPNDIKEFQTHGFIIAAQDPSSVDWKWGEWKWKEDALVSMCCRILQVSRLALGVHQPLGCWHPLDDPAELLTAIESMHRHRRDRGEMQLFDDRKERGWIPLKEISLSLTRTLPKASSETMKLSIATELETKATELRMDLLDGKQLRRLFVCTFGGIDPFNETSSFKSLTWAANDYTAIKLAVDLYAAFHGVVSSRFGRIDVENSMPCASEPFNSLLAPGTKDGACRVSAWAKKLGVELGMDGFALEAMVQIAHGYIGGTDASSKDSVLHVLAKRLRMAPRIIRNRKKGMDKEISGAMVLEQLCTKEWGIESCTILAEYLGLAPQVVNAIIEASRNNVKGWIKLHACLFPPAKEGRHAWRRFESVQGPLNATESSRANVAKRTSQNAQKAADVVTQGFRAFFQEQEDHSQDAQNRLIEVLLIFDKDHHKERKASATTQTGWLADLVERILRRLRPDYQKLSPLVSSTSALILHLLSGQNVAAGVVLNKDSELCKAAGLDEKTGKSLLNLAHLTKNRGALRLQNAHIAEISNNLAEPLVDRIFQLRSEDSYMDSSIPKDVSKLYEDFPIDWDDEQAVRVMIKERLVMCLDCMLGMAVKDNQRVLDSIRRVMELGVRRITEKYKNGKLLLESEDSSTLRKFAHLPVDWNIVQLMQDEPAVRQFVLVQSFHLLEKLRFNTKKRLDTKSGKGSQTLNKMARAMFHAIIPWREHPLGKAQSHLESPHREDLGTTIKVENVSPRSSLRLHQTLSGTTPFHYDPKSGSFGNAQTLGNLRQQSRNAMQYFFIGIAIHAQNQKASSGSALQQIRRFLPILAAAATGRLDQLLYELKNLAGGSSHAKDIDFMIDLLCLLGIDEGLFKDLRTHMDKMSFLGTLLDRIMQWVVDVDGKDELKDLVGRLIKLLVAICVGAPPTDIASKQTAILPNVTAYLGKWLRKSDDTQFVKAGLRLVTLTTKMMNQAVAEKSSVQIDDEPLTKKMSQAWQEKSSEQIDDEQEQIPENIESEILDASLDLLLPFIPQDMREPLSAVLKLMSVLKHVAENPGVPAFKKYQLDIIEHMSTALCVPKANIKGVIALSQGDWAGAVELCKPFCSLDPDVLRQISLLLPSVQKTVVSAKDRLTGQDVLSEVAQLNSHFAGRVEQITADALNNKGTPEEIFELVDVDRNGFISQEEFQLLMSRLDFNLNSHRIVEIMSSCKKTRPGSKSKLTGATDMEIDAANGLDQEEFKEALRYLQSVVARNAMQNMKISWPRLMFLLFVFGVVLVLLFLFIYLGINGFVSGGVFSSVVNSVVTIAAGFGGFKIFKAGGTDTERKAGDSKHAKALVQEVKDTFFSSS